LTLLEKAGKIRGLQQQPEFILQPAFKLDNKTIRAITYTADFQYWDGSHLVIEDCKGYKTQIYQLKRKILLFQKRNDSDWEFRET